MLYWVFRRELRVGPLCAFQGGTAMWADSSQLAILDIRVSRAQFRSLRYSISGNAVANAMLTKLSVDAIVLQRTPTPLERWAGFLLVGLFPFVSGEEPLS